MSDTNTLTYIHTIHLHPLARVHTVSLSISHTTVPSLLASLLASRPHTYQWISDSRAENPLPQCCE